MGMLPAIAELAWPAVLLVYLASLVLHVVDRCHGSFTYALDDAYIHMGLARQVAEHGVWGVGDGFASAASSLLWPSILAVVYWLKGPDGLTPLVLEFVGVLALFVVVRRVLAREHPTWAARGWPSGLAGLVIATAAAVPTLLIEGMEHLWHLVAVIAVVDRAVVAFAADVEPAVQTKARRQLPWLAPLLTVVRFETIALVPCVVLLAIWRRRWRLALAVATTSTLPLVILGLVSQSRGGFFRPNTLMLLSIAHGPGQDLVGKVTAAAAHLADVLTHNAAYLAVLLLAVALLALALATYRRVAASPVLMLGLFLVQALAHALFGSFGWLYRYESYVLGFGVFACLHASARLWRDHVAAWWSGRRLVRVLSASLPVVLLWTLSGFHLRDRTRYAIRATPGAACNIFEQQMQFAQFLQRFYPGDSVALNDIGTTCYLTDLRILDLYGLGSNAVARLRIDGGFDRDAIERLAREKGVALAIVYDSWFADTGLPKSWTKVGEWEIQGNVICASPVISFYGVDAGSTARLRRNLEAFAPQLPASVVQRIDSLGLDARAVPAPR